METKIEVRNLRYSYGREIEALRGISFQVEEGEVFGVLGPNGAGKTTLLKCVVGILSLQRGEIFLEGKRVSEIPPRDLAKVLAYVPQTQHYTFSFRVLDFVLIGRAPYCGMFSVPGRKDLEMARAALGSLGISDLADRTISELSGGELRLVLIARALAQEPKILTLDEPSSHLDISNKFKVLGTVRSLVKSGRVSCALITMHDPFLCSIFCDRVMLLEGGKEVKTGTPEEVLTPENLSKVYGLPFRRIELDGTSVSLPFPSE